MCGDDLYQVKQMKQKTIEKENNITIKVISGYCLVSPITVRRWIKDRKLSAMKLPSGHYRITTAGFRDFLERYDMPIREDLFSPNIEKRR
jgi:phenolic acid decarboxylase